MPEYKDIIPSSEMETSSSGATRSSEKGKGRFDLISVHGLTRLAKHYEKGSEKHNTPRNWEKGLSMARYVSSIMRHAVRYLGGDRSEDHLAAISWNAFALMDHEERIERGLLDPLFNDLPKSGTYYKEDEFLNKTSKNLISTTHKIIPLHPEVKIIAENEVNGDFIFQAPIEIYEQWKRHKMTPNVAYELFGWQRLQNFTIQYMFMQDYFVGYCSKDKKVK